jgi:hypothetical protein
MIDLFGTPYTKSLHVVERYRLREYDVKDAIDLQGKLGRGEVLECGLVAQAKAMAPAAG